MYAASLTMQIKNNAEVTLPDGTAVGRVDRVVLDPRTREVTHLIVRKGLLFTTDKVVPASWIAAASEQGVTLHARAADLDALPEFEEEVYVRVSDEDQPGAAGAAATALYWYPLGASTPGHLPAHTANDYALRTMQNIPEGTVALRKGAKVLTRDDEHVGNVEEIITDAQTERALGLVISKGLLFKETRRVPSTWVDHITEDEVRLLVGARQLEALGFDAN